MKFSQLIEYKKKNIFLRNQTDNEEARLVSHPFFFKKKKKKKASLPLHQRFQKAFAEKIKYQKNFSEILFRQLK